MERVIVIGTKHRGGLGDFLLDKGLSLQFLTGRGIPERFTAIMEASFPLGALIFMEPENIDQQATRSRILEIMQEKKWGVSTLIIGSHTWQEYVEMSRNYVHFAAERPENKDLLEWIRYVAP